MPDLNVLTELDIAELIVRVSRYEKDIPVSYQAIVKGRTTPTGPWGVGVRSNPNAAVEAALAEYAEIVQGTDRGNTGMHVSTTGERYTPTTSSIANNETPSKYGF